MNKLDVVLIFFISFFLLVVSLFSDVGLSSGAPDLGDYAGVAKFFANELNAKIRSSHSYLYGFVHFPLVSLTNSLIIMRLFGIFYLFILIFSVYYISGKNRRALFMILLSPIVWYVGPWIHPMALSSALFLWGYHFMKKYNATGKIFFLLISGILVGLAWSFWDAIMFFSVFLGIVFLYDKKLYHSGIYLFFLLIGLF
ncbi:hypothetical protein HY450_02360, partial [Candidatus Pacearchaeota archaeon]|nr:hypothetical protein [Candidatus Pacearchaeota archaeon]